MNYSTDKNYSNLTGSDWTSIGTSAVGAILTGVSTKAQADASRREAETALQNNQTALELAKIGLQTAQINASAKANPTTASSNKNLYIALGIGGVVILGVVIFFS